jgi:uncharacterized protein
MQLSTLATPLSERIERLAKRIGPHPRPGYHAFEREGTRLVYDILTGGLLEPSEHAFRILRAIETQEPSSQVLSDLAEIGDHGIEHVLGEIEALYDAGLLRKEDDYSEEVKHGLVRSLMQHRPRKMMLMVQTNCNLKCTYCYEVLNGFHSTGKSMGYETGCLSVEFLIKRSGPRRDLEITFFGGEPLLNFPLVRELVAYCRGRETDTGKRFSFQLTTNCTLLNDEIIAFLVEHEFAVMLSLDGPPELHDIHRKDLGGHGTGAVALENAKRLVAAQKRAGIREAMVRITMSHENHDARALSAYFESQGFGRVMLGATDGRADHKDPWDLDPSDVQELSEQGEASLSEYLDWIDGRSPRPADASQVTRNLGPILEALRSPDPRPKVRCGVARNMQAITREGKIYPCHRYAGEDAFQLGTLDAGLDPVKVEAYYGALLKVKEEHCSHCWARITCGGQCPWYISKESGEIGHPDEPSCNGIRRGHERQLWFVHQLMKRGKLSDIRSEVEQATESA